MTAVNWNNNLVQFARLLCEINATQQLDVAALYESMDLDAGDVTNLFDRANEVWERAKNPPPPKCECCGTTENLHRDYGSGGPYRCNSSDCVVF